ncbi:hypothetical protein OCOL_000382 [Ordospora colligata]|uniref:Uncharacterized protein n=1 Tax=Ordospora colligata OC4 TaxID=1354746 RepID=A0A0B2UDA3_9MICR|nr:uncharacterized protein M896_100350 [Ordospora colligata OC4]KHN69051.1 hypothetical protein M896_100350 [Ordospora colligata OC4]TBU14332.1 hypothetical protein CWI40_100360 [Ordospora colligata]TBU14397.1 hypothetical protein CWI41_100360 [Ordospora colligata]
MAVNRLSKSKDKLLEKKIYKSALLETVEVLNKKADEKDLSNKKKRKATDEDASGENGVPWIIKKPKTDPYKTTANKQRRNQEAKEMRIQKRKNKQESKNSESVESEEHSRKTRKERKQEKINGRGNGISSKEYYEKFVKKSSGISIQNSHKSNKNQNSDSNNEKFNRDGFASKRKTDFPTNTKGRHGSKSNDKKRSINHKKRREY